MPSYIGNTVAVPNRFRYAFDPIYGDSYIFVFSGSEASIRLLGQFWRNQGARVNIEHEGAHWFLEIHIATEQVGGVEIPVDVWETDTELAHEDLYANPRIYELARQVNPLDPDETLAIWRNAIEEAIDTKSVFEDAPSGTDPEQLIYNLRIRGTDTTEVERPVLRRVRFVSPAYAAPARIDNPPLIWTTTSLISAFAIPAVITIKLPPNPATRPSNTEWGWKRRQNDSRYHRAINKFEETMSWYFSAWSTVQYQFV